MIYGTRSKTIEIVYGMIKAFEENGDIEAYEKAKKIFLEEIDLMLKEPVYPVYASHGISHFVKMSPWWR